MRHDVLVEKVVQNLSFEVVTVPNDSAVEVIGQSGRAPLKVNVKVRKKGKPDVCQENTSIEEQHASGAVTDKVRYVSSDKTITSFDMFLEAEQKLPTKKHRNKFFDILKPGMFLRNQGNEKDFYVHRTSQNTVSSVTSKSDGVLKEHLPLSKKDYLEESTSLSRKNQYFLGKCKPGGCLDPPFGEEKYSYIPIQKHSHIETSTLTSSNLYIGDDIGASKKDSARKIKALSCPDRSVKDDRSPQERPAKSIQKLYAADSVNTSMSITYSSSIITYPPPLTASEIRLSNEKNGEQRQSIDSKTRKSYELPQSYFLPPKVITNQFDKKGLHEPSIEISVSETSTESQTAKIIKITPLVDDPKYKESLDGHASTAKGSLIEGIQQMSFHPTTPRVEKHKLKSNDDSPETPDIVPLCHKIENSGNFEKTSPTQINILKISSTSILKPTESKDGKEPPIPFESGTDTNDEQKPAKQLLTSGLDTDLLNVLGIASQLPTLSKKSLTDDIVSNEKENYVSGDINATPVPLNKAEKQLPSDKEEQQKDYIDNNVLYTDAKNIEPVKKTESQKSLTLNQEDGTIYPRRDSREENVSYPPMDQKQPENRINMLDYDKINENVLKEKSIDMLDHDKINENVLKEKSIDMLDHDEINENVLKEKSIEHLGDTHDSEIKTIESDGLPEKLFLRTVSPEDFTPFNNLNDFNDKMEQERNVDPQADEELDSHKDQDKKPSHIDAEYSSKPLTELRLSEDEEKSVVSVREDIFDIKGTVPADTEIEHHNIEPIEGDDEKLPVTSDKIPSQQFKKNELSNFIIEPNTGLEVSPDMDRTENELELEKHLDIMPLRGIVDSSTIQLSPDGQLNGSKPTEEAPYLLQQLSSTLGEYGVEDINVPNTQTLMIAPPGPQENEYQNIFLQDKNKLFINKPEIENDQVNLQTYKSSTMYDVIAKPDPKKLKDDIALLKNTSVRFTPSETTINSGKKDSVTVDLAFHSYVNEKSEKILKTFKSDDEPHRYLDDSIIIIKSDISLPNNEIKIPIDMERNLIVQLRIAGDIDDRNQLDESKVHTQPDKINVKKTILKHIDTRSTDKSKITNTMSIYENELLPLHNAIKDLKEEVEYLARYNLLLKDNLAMRKLKQMRLSNVNKRCACLKRMY